MQSKIFQENCWLDHRSVLFDEWMSWLKFGRIDQLVLISYTRRNTPEPQTDVRGRVLPNVVVFSTTDRTLDLAVAGWTLDLSSHS